MADVVLAVNNLCTYFPVYRGLFFKRRAGVLKAVDGVTFTMKRGDVLGLVGESGCGKSTLGRSIMQLEPIWQGTVEFESRILNRLSYRELTRIRPRFQMIFQDPYASLDPRMTAFDIISEPLRYHRRELNDDSVSRITGLMAEVGLDGKDGAKYPHEFSGGQRQRIAIARALTLKPELIIADEPVSALDVSVQSQILNLMDRLIQVYNLTMLFISHDLSVIRHITDRVAVMYLGKIVEIAGTAEIFKRPLHPYTQALFAAIPIVDPEKEKQRKPLLLRGDPPSPVDHPSGCSFHTRCPRVMEICRELSPALSSPPGERSTHHAACHRLK